MFKVLAYGATHVGRERKNNEDAFRIAPDAGVYLVCDGMGGHASGEIASQVAADTMVRFLAMDRFRPEFRWPAESMQHPFEEARALDAAVRAANREVFIQALANPAHKGMGTTVAGIHAGAQRLGLVHVGDSRIYRLRAGEFEQVTEDHSLLNYYLQSRPMSDQQIKQFAAKNVIIRAVGLRETVEPTVQIQDYRAGDIYLLCSDGLNDMVDDDVIESVVRAAPNRLAEASEELIQLALDGGGKDNVTVLMLQVLEMAEHSPRQDFLRRTLAIEAGELDTSPGMPTPDLTDDESELVEEPTSPAFDFNHDEMTGARPFAKTQPMTMRPFLGGEAVIPEGELPADVDEATPSEGTQPVGMVDNASGNLDWLEAPTLPLPAAALRAPAAAAVDNLDWLEAATLPAAETRRLPSVRAQAPQLATAPDLPTLEGPVRGGAVEAPQSTGNALVDSELDTDPALRQAASAAARSDTGRAVAAPSLSASTAPSESADPDKKSGKQDA